MISERQRCLNIAFIQGSNEYRPCACWGPFHAHFRVWVILIVEDPAGTVKCETASNALFLSFNLCFRVISHVQLHPYPFILRNMIENSYATKAFLHPWFTMLCINFFYNYRMYHLSDNIRIISRRLLRDIDWMLQF